WLSFLRGLVDSDTLPLNVSREMLQAHSSLKTIRKKLVRKVLDHLKRLADEEAKCAEERKEGGGKEGDKENPKECSRYSDFWKEFGRSIKLGVIEDSTNRLRLAKLLRFRTSKSPDAPTSLDAYVSGVKLSARLASTPCVVVAGRFGQTANMERIMRAQALGDGAAAAAARAQRALEINPRHPLIKALLARVESDADDATAAESAALLFETALLESGYALDDPKARAGSEH
ncbi:endoplasmin, partial [Raphidocelis subcapitata]